MGVGAFSFQIRRLCGGLLVSRLAPNAEPFSPEFEFMTADGDGFGIVAANLLGAFAHACVLCNRGATSYLCPTRRGLGLPVAVL